MIYHIKTSHCLWRSTWHKPRWGDRQLVFPPLRDSERVICRLVRIRGKRWWGTRISEPLRHCETSVRMLRWQGHHLRARLDPAATTDRRYLRSLQEMARKREVRRHRNL